MRIRTIILLYLNCIALNNNNAALLYIIKFRPSYILNERKLSNQSIKFGFVFLFSAIKSNPILIQMPPDNVRNQNQVSGIYA